MLQVILILGCMACIRIIFENIRKHTIETAVIYSVMPFLLLVVSVLVLVLV